MINKIMVLVCMMSFLFSQTLCDGHCLSDDTVKTLRTSILQLEYSDSMNVQIIDNLEYQVQLFKRQNVNDSLLLHLYEEKIDLLDERVELYKELAKEVEPSWYENKWIWFTFGILTTSTSINLASKIVK
tara:strand:+ start:517 stop:903 length:387 start_codon:yes stop_codon:yes gene_type:complete